MAKASTDATAAEASASKLTPPNSNSFPPQHPTPNLDPSLKSFHTPPHTPAVSLGSKRVNVLAMQTDVNSIFSNAFVREGSAIGIHCATPCPICNHTLLDEEVRTHVSEISSSHEPYDLLTCRINNYFTSYLLAISRCFYSSFLLIVSCILLIEIFCISFNMNLNCYCSSPITVCLPPCIYCTVHLP